jgi:predicted kinase
MKRLIILVGLPASGKSTIAKNLVIQHGGVIVATDKIREELYGTRKELGGKEIFTEAKNRIVKAFKDGEKNVYFDATNLRSKKRASFIRSIQEQIDEKISVVALLIAVSKDTVRIQNERRPQEHQVPAYVIERMLRNFQMPMYHEGFSHIIVFYNDIFNFMHEYNIHNQHFFGAILDLMDFDQESHYHSLTLGEHLYATCINLREMMRGDAFRDGQEDRFQTVSEAGLLHDIGKQYTKTFYNTKGVLDDTAHYYGHESFGAYESLFYPTKAKSGMKAIIYRAQLISNHMMPYHFNTKSQTELNKKLLRKFKDQNFVDDLMLLHMSDVNSH